MADKYLPVVQVPEKFVVVPVPCNAVSRVNYSECKTGRSDQNRVYGQGQKVRPVGKNSTLPTRLTVRGGA